MAYSQVCGFKPNNYLPYLEDIIVYPFGSDLCLWYFEQKNKRDYLKATRNGFTAFTVNNVRHLIAAAEYGINPEALLFRYPPTKDKKEPMRIKLGIKIQAVAMDFSRDGNRLVVVGGLPDYNITVYDAELGVQLRGINEKLPDKEVKKLLFKPDDNNCFVLQTASGFYVYEIEQTGDYENNESIVSYKLRCKTLEQNMVINDILWDKQGRLLVLDKVGSRIVIYGTKQENLIEIGQKEMPAEPLAMLLTQTQIIVSLADSTLKWYEFTYENNANKKDIGSAIGKDPEQEIINDKGPFNHMVYNNQMTKILATTADNLIFTIPSEAQCEEEDEEQADAGGREGDPVVRTKPKAMPIRLGDFLTNKIVGIKELLDSTQVLTLSDDKNVCIWELTNMQQLTKFEIRSKPTCLEVDTKGGVAFIGCIDGTIQIIDLSDRTTLRLVNVLKLFVNPITNIRRSPDGGMLVAYSSREKGIYFISTGPFGNFPVIAYLPLIGKVNSVDWYQPSPSAPLKIIVLLHNSLLVSLSPPSETVRNQRMNPDKTPAAYSVVDNNMTHLLCTPTGDILLTGADRKLKKYDVPDMMYADINMQKPALAPMGEFPGHGLEVQCWDASSDAKFLVSGSRDGTYQVRMLSSLEQPKEGKTHSVHQGGITSISFSPVRSAIYIGGGDGSFMTLYMGKDQPPTAPITPVPEEFDETLRNLVEINKEDPISDKIVLDKWHEEEIAREKEEKEKIKANIKKELHNVRESLKTLLQKNAEVQDIEKLDREEFLIDKPRKIRMLDERDQESIKLRKLAAKENLRNEVLWQRMKERTWDTMEIQSTGCRSLFTDQIMFNFQIRKQSKDELDRYTKLVNNRRLELKDLTERKAEEILLDTSDFGMECEHYIVNRFRSQPVVKEELQEKLQPASATQAAGMSTALSAALIGTTEKEKLAYKYRRPGMARRGKRAVADVEDMYGKEKKEDHKEDDTRLTVKQQKKEIEYYRKNWKALEAYELLYEPFELQSNARKRAQIYFIQEIIRRMKKEFNKEFEELCNSKSEQISIIKEKNQKIEELLKDLKESMDKFEIKEDKREQPELILKVEDSDMKIPKYLTKEEREKLEEEKRKEEERNKALQSDTLGRRGVVKMMNGVLEIKREFDELEKALVRQPWMDLPENQMTEPQRQEFTKFRQMEEDLKERKLNQQKAWRQELNKAKNEIEEICQKFEEKMNKLAKRKHFMQLRVYEQELYIIRLSLSLYEEKLLRENKDKTEIEIKDLEEILVKYEEIRASLQREGQHDMQEDEENPPEQPQADDREAERQEIEGSIEELKHQLYSNYQTVYPSDLVESLKAFLENGKEELAKVQEKEKKLSLGKDRKEDSLAIFKRSPYLQIDKEIVNKQEVYNPRTDNVFAKLPDEEFKNLIEMRQQYVTLKKKLETLESEELAKKNYNATLDFQIRNTQQDYENKKIKLEELLCEIQKYEENIELIIRIKQEQVEISLLDIAPNLEQAVLIKQDVITGYNKHIKEEADNLYKNLKESSTIEKDRKKNDWQIKVLDKEIEYLDTCINTVMQERIGRHPVFKKRDELPMLESEKIKTLDKQIAKLNDNANRRIKAINGKIMMLEKQIMDKKKENEELEQNARKKEESVKQRLEILDLSSGGGGEEVRQETENKMKIIATKRKLKDMLLQQEEEFMMLSEELNKIREKTFPSFAHVQAKYEYPDEKPV